MALAFLNSILFPTEYRYRPLPTQHDSYPEKRSDSPKPTNHRMCDYGLVASFPPAEKAKGEGDDGSSIRARINPRIISDLTIGLSDGLTVPFALTAGLSALGDSSFVIYGGLAELIAGSISMGLGGYLGAKGESEAYQASLSETQAIVDMDRPKAAAMVHDAFLQYNFSKETLDAMAATLLADPAKMTGFLMQFHNQLAEADYTPSRSYISGLTISAGYFFGGLIPLMPYLFFAQIYRAFIASVIVMALALFTFGWVKTALVGDCSKWLCFKNALQMLVLGGLAAGAAMVCVTALGS